MPPKSKGYLLSYFGLWSALLLIAVITFILFWVISLSAANSVCHSVNCNGFIGGLSGSILGGLIALVLTLFAGFFGLIVIIPLSVYFFLRINGLQQRALRTSLYLALFLLVMPFISWLILVSGNSQVNKPLFDNRVTLAIIFAIVWTHVVVFIARRLALVGFKAGIKQSK